MGRGGRGGSWERQVVIENHGLEEEEEEKEREGGDPNK